LGVPRWRGAGSSLQSFSRFAQKRISAAIPNAGMAQDSIGITFHPTACDSTPYGVGVKTHLFSGYRDVTPDGV